MIKEFSTVFTDSTSFAILVSPENTSNLRGKRRLRAVGVES